MKCDGNHGGPRCADPECWNDDGRQLVKAAIAGAPIYVVVMSHGGALTEAHPVKGGPIVMETEVDGNTLENARAWAGRLEHVHGACRIARLVFEDVDGRPL